MKIYEILLDTNLLLLICDVNFLLTSILTLKLSYDRIKVLYL